MRKDVIWEAKQYLLQDCGKKVPFGTTGDVEVEPDRQLQGIVSADLAFSVILKRGGTSSGLWVPFIIKAYGTFRITTNAP